MANPSHIELIVGLGNPGPEYERTLHNAGFWVVDALASRMNASFKRFKSIGSHFNGRVADHACRVYKPETFMNRSGQALRPFLDFYDIEPSSILVVHDDVDLDLHTLRLKKGGGSGGHNGLKNMFDVLGTRDFYRLRFGVGRPTRGNDVAGYVLKPCRMDAYEDDIHTSMDMIEALFEDELKVVQNRFHAS